MGCGTLFYPLVRPRTDGDARAAGQMRPVFGRGRSASCVGKNELTFPGTRPSPSPPPPAPALFAPDRPRSLAN